MTTSQLDITNEGQTSQNGKTTLPYTDLSTFV